MDDRSLPITVQQLLPAPVARVWQIITEPEHMRQWFFDDIPDFKPEVGFQTSFPVIANGRTFTHQWTITEIEKEKHITYAWRYAEYAGQGQVTFSLQPQGEQCLLLLTNLGLDTFPADIPEFSRASCLGGWTYFIQDQLMTYVSSRARSLASPDAK